MPSLSLFDMFKIGVGPSSSHTMGPWVAARRFLDELPPTVAPHVQRVLVELYGSLAKTGRGHGTDIAVQLGLGGHDPRTVDVNQIGPLIRQIKETKKILLATGKEIAFDPKTDLQFLFQEQLPAHPNALRLTAFIDNATAVEAVYYSVGGGFVVKEGEPESTTDVVLPCPIESATDLLRHCDTHGLGISQVVMRNELAWRDHDAIVAGVRAIRNAMFDCAHTGCLRDGVLPGGLNVQRRAARIAAKLLGHPVPEDRDEWLAAVSRQTKDFSRILDWVSCFALAVNEENAAFGRVVTAPTNGAAGVIPAVLLYQHCFINSDESADLAFLLTASEIGCIFKKGATISAAMGGCQAEIGVSSAMAAAALAEQLGATPAQSATAAEIAMEHHLGMTCDPIGGLVQIPCIERNAMGAIKAITAARIAIQRDSNEARVSLDTIVRTMWETALDMNAKYKETSEGGLATQIAVNLSEC